MKSHYLPSDLKRITVQLKLDPTAKPRVVWGSLKQSADRTYAFIRVHNREGEETNEVIMCSPMSVLKAQPCRMNATYCQLEVIT